MSNASSKLALPAKDAISRVYPWGVGFVIGVLIIGLVIAPILIDVLMSAVSSAFGADAAAVRAWLYDSPAGTFLRTILQSSTLLGVIIWFVHSRKESFRRAVALHALHWKDLGYAIVGVVVYVMLFVVSLTIVNAIVPIDTTKEQAIGFERDIRGAALVMAFASLVIIPPLVEEMVFRGFLYGTFRGRNIRIGTSIFITSAIFGFLHLFGSNDGLLWIAFLDTFVLSIVLCVLRETTGSIWASIMVHALKNGFVFVNLFLLHAM